MTTPKKTLPKTYALEHANKSLEILMSLPEKKSNKLNRQEYVAHIRDGIEQALAKGQTLTDITERLNENGFEIALGTLKSYMPKTAKPVKKAARQVKVKTDAAATR